MEAMNLGPPTQVCEHCGAQLWYEERTIKSRKPKKPKFSLCCSEGKVELPFLKDPPPFLKERDLGTVLRYCSLGCLLKILPYGFFLMG